MTHEQRKILDDIQELELRAHNAKMTVTGHALNNAKNAAGWELAGDAFLAGKASRGERADEMTELEKYGGGRGGVRRTKSSHPGARNG